MCSSVGVLSKQHICERTSLTIGSRPPWWTPIPRPSKFRMFVICGSFLSDPARPPSAPLTPEELKARLTLQPRQAPLDRDMHFTLFRRRAQVRIRHTRRILLAPPLTERKHHHRKQFLLLEQPNQVDPQRRIPSLDVPPASPSPSSSLSSSSDGASLTSSTAVLPATRSSASTWGAAACRATADGGSDAGGFAVLVLLAADRLAGVLVPESTINPQEKEECKRETDPWLRNWPLASTILWSSLPE